MISKWTTGKRNEEETWRKRKTVKRKQETKKKKSTLNKNRRKDEKNEKAKKYKQKTKENVSFWKIFRLKETAILIYLIICKWKRYNKEIWIKQHHKVVKAKTKSSLFIYDGQQTIAYIHEKRRKNGNSIKVGRLNKRKREIYVEIIKGTLWKFKKKKWKK